VDDESLVRTPGDLQEGDDPLPIGNYANCCAVTLRESGWMVPGKDDLVSLVRGQVYKFYAEKEQT
jgi:adenylate/nucleoside-diphosphate kinase